MITKFHQHMRKRSLLFTSVFLLATARQVSGSCAGVTPPVLTSQNTDSPLNIIADELIAYYCDSTTYFSNGETFMLSKCVNNQWVTIESSVTCATGTPPTYTCAAGGAPTVVDAAPDSTANIPSGLLDMIQIYKCDSTKSWLTGESRRISQCKGSSWSEVLDICDDGCTVPKDCSDVQELGLTDDGTYNVIATGDPQGTVTEVHCVLEAGTITASDNGAGWTVIFKNTKTDGTMTNPEDAYKEGFSYSEDKFFVGLDYLAELTEDMILEVIVRGSGGAVLSVASYDEFNIGTAADNYKLNSLGQYHGTAGDALCPHLATPFNFAAAADTMWWGTDSAGKDDFLTNYDGSYLTDAGVWQTLEQSHLANMETIEMRIRPADLENDLCPHLVGMQESWSATTSAQIPYARIVGTQITWNCIGDYMFEGAEGGTRSQSGTATCVAGASGAKPAWDVANVDLPCTLKCPTDFQMTPDARTCFHFSTDTATSLFQAAEKCRRDLSATLAVAAKATDFDLATTDNYYVSDTYGNGMSFPGWDQDAGLACKTPSEPECTADATRSCSTLSKPNLYLHQDCYAETKYACQVPPQCQLSYFKNMINGCFLYDTAPATTVKAAYEACKSKSGLAGLPFVSDDVSLRNLINAINQDITNSKNNLDSTIHTFPQTIAIGMNEGDDGFSLNGIYDMDATLDLTEGNAKTYRTVSIELDSSSYTLGTVDIDEEISPALLVVCQLWQVRNCFEDPSSPKENMYRDWDGSSMADDDTATYICTDGYFHNSTDLATYEMESTCMGQLGQWVDGPKVGCTIAEVCDFSSLVYEEATYTNLNNNSASTPDVNYLNASITFSCDTTKHMAMDGGSTSITIECQYVDRAADPRTYGYSGLTPIPACKVCTEDVTIAHSTNDLSTSQPILVGSQLTITCDSNYQWSFGEDEQTLECTEKGYDQTALKECKPACSGDPPVVANMVEVTADDVNDVTIGNSVGTILEYNCTQEGYYYKLSSPNYLTPKKRLTVECKDTFIWEGDVRPDIDMVCQEICIEALPNTTALSVTVSGWDELTRTTNTEVTYTAPSGELLGNYLDNLTLVCNGSHWVPDADSNTAYISTGYEAILVSRKACLDDPVSNYGGALPVNFDLAGTQVGFVNDSLIYRCPSGQATDKGLFETSITCAFNSSTPLVAAAWSAFTEPAAEFVCQDACTGKPPDAPALAALQGYTGDFTDGVIVTYTCPGGFNGKLGTTLISNCTDGAWSINPVPLCLTITEAYQTTPTPYVPPLVDPHNKLYPDSETDVHVANPVDLELNSNRLGDPEQVKSLFGFGTGVSLESEKYQCVLQENFVASKNDCPANPENCPNGFSYSIWAKPFFEPPIDGDDYMAVGTIDDRNTIVSIGGDEFGHPGFAMYTQKHRLKAIVSFGSQFWLVSVLGALRSGDWVNLGVAFHPTHGLRLFKNAEQIGHCSGPETYSGTTKDGVETPILLLGCHITSTDDTYRNFITAHLDEYASWPEYLEGDKVTQMLGGFDLVNEPLDPTLFGNADTSNPDIFNSLLQFSIQSMNTPTDDDADPTATPTQSTDDDDGTNAAVPSVPTINTANTGDVQTLIKNGKMGLSLTDVNKVPATLTKDGAKAFLGVSSLTSGLLNAKHNKNWVQATELQEEAGVMQIISNFVNWKFLIMSRIEYGVDTESFCIETIKDNLYSLSCKQRVSEFMEMGDQIKDLLTLPDYRQVHIKKLQVFWEDITDIIKIPVNVFKIKECMDRVLTFDFTMFRIAHLGAATIMHPFFDEYTYIRKLDSRILSFKFEVEHNPSIVNLTECYPDQKIMRKNPMRIVTENVKKDPANTIPVKRLTSLFDVKVETMIEERVCVRWNKDVNDYGVWDPTGCEMGLTTSESSMCFCDRDGVTAVISRVLKERKYDDIPGWLEVIVPILKIASAFLIILYIIIVAISKELKDQFHLIGFNLAIAILASYLTDLLWLVIDHENRDTCFVFGTMFHIINGAIGVWGFGLAHASFRAITNGVIRGHLLSYSLLCWGFAILSSGIPMVVFDQKFLGDDPLCVIGWENMVKYTFFIPQIFFLSFGMFYSCVILCNLATPALRKDNLIEDYGTFCRGAACLILIIFVTWFFAFLAFARFDVGKNFMPAYYTLHASTGICLFMFIGLGSTRFRSVLTRETELRRAQLKAHAFGTDEGPPPLPDTAGTVQHSATGSSAENLVSKKK